MIGLRQETTDSDMRGRHHIPRLDRYASRMRHGVEVAAEVMVGVGVRGGLSWLRFIGIGGVLNSREAFASGRQERQCQRGTVVGDEAALSAGGGGWRVSRSWRG